MLERVDPVFLPPPDGARGVDLRGSRGVRTPGGPLGRASFGAGRKAAQRNLVLAKSTTKNNKTNNTKKVQE